MRHDRLYLSPRRPGQDIALDVVEIDQADIGPIDGAALLDDETRKLFVFGQFGARLHAHPPARQIHRAGKIDGRAVRLQALPHQAGHAVLDQEPASVVADARLAALSGGGEQTEETLDAIQLAEPPADRAQIDAGNHGVGEGEARRAAEAGDQLEFVAPGGGDRNLGIHLARHQFDTGHGEQELEHSADHTAGGGPLGRAGECRGIGAIHLE